jgi:Ca2+/H+ antiporter
MWLVLCCAAATSQDDVDVLTVSRFTAVALLFMYLQLLFFQLKSHAHLYEDDVSSAASLIHTKPCNVRIPYSMFLVVACFILQRNSDHCLLKARLLPLA